MPYRPKLIHIGCGVAGEHSSVLLWLHKESPELTQILQRINALEANKETSCSQEGQRLGLRSSEASALSAVPPLEGDF